MRNSTRTMPSFAPAIFDVAGEIICDYIFKQQSNGPGIDGMRTAMRTTAFHRTKRLYKARLGWLDAEQIRREILTRLYVPEPGGETQRRKLIKPKPNAPTLPEPFETMLGQSPLSAPDALKQIIAHLDVQFAQAAKTSADQDAAGIATVLRADEMDQKIDIAHRKGFERKTDVVDFFTPHAGGVAVTDQLTLTGAATEAPVCPFYRGFQDGDAKGAADYRAANNMLLSFRSSWAFKNCAMRSKGKDSDDRGWDTLIRLVARRAVETSASPAAYPG